MNASHEDDTTDCSSDVHCFEGNFFAIKSGTAAVCHRPRVLVSGGGPGTGDVYLVRMLLLVEERV